MKQVLLLLLLVLFASATVELTTFPTVGALQKLQDPSAICLDGSPGSFYFFPAQAGSAGADKWIIYKQGGGICSDGASCLQRSKTFLGSSTVLHPTKPVASLNGLLSRNCSISPELCEFNVVFLNYCDGVLYSGARDAPYVYNGVNLYFRGRNILYATLEELQKSTTFGNASTVLLAGGSAGAYGTFIHTDALAAWINTNIPSVKKIRSTPMSGYFLSRANYDFQEFIWEVLAYIAPIANITPSLSQTCLEDSLPGLHGYCGFAPTLYGYNANIRPELEDGRLAGRLLNPWRSEGIRSSSIPVLQGTWIRTWRVCPTRNLRRLHPRANAPSPCVPAWFHGPHFSNAHLPQARQRSIHRLLLHSRRFCRG